MSGLMRGKHLGIALTLILATADGSRADEPAGLFPSVEGWKMSPGAVVYTTDNLWDIIDGAAEVFLSYGFVDLHIAEYENDAATDVRVELYRHDSRANAFGIYAQERKPGYHFVPLGTQGYIEEYVLNYLSGSFYVKVSSHRKGKEGLDAMTLVARKVEEHLKQERQWPPPLALFPPEGRIANAETYVAENFLGYRFLHSAFVAEYGANSPFRMFIIECDSAREVVTMVDAYLHAVKHPGKIAEGSILAVRDPHHGELLIVVQGRHFLGVIGGGGERGLAEGRLRQLVTSLSEAGQ